MKNFEYKKNHEFKMSSEYEKNPGYKKNLKHEKMFIMFQVVVWILIFISGCSKTPEKAMVEPVLAVYNLHIEDGDCAVLFLKDGYGDIKETGMIDTGTRDSFDEISDFLDKNSVEDIAFLMLTHYDKDHIGSAVDILDKYNVNTVFIPDYVSEKKLYPNLMDNLKDREGVRIISSDTSYSWQDVTVDIYPAFDKEKMLEKEDDLDNNMSLVMRFGYEDNELLFTGDIENARIKDLLGQEPDIDCDWIKMPHHGVHKKQNKKLIEAVTPRYAVISCSKEDGIEDKTIELLEENDVEIFDTMNGNVMTVCSKEGISVTKE